MTDSVDAIGIALKVTSALDTLGVVHTIGGSIASSMAGEPRSTIDVDIIADLKAEHVPDLVAALQQDFCLDETCRAHDWTAPISRPMPLPSASPTCSNGR